MEASCRVAQIRGKLKIAKEWPLFIIIFLSLFSTDTFAVKSSDFADVELALKQFTKVEPGHGACLIYSAKAYKLPPTILLAILAVEGGATGTKNVNNDGSYDHGPAQINTVREKEIAHFISGLEEVEDDTCVNLNVMAFLLARHMYEYEGQFWTAVGAYHYRPTGKYPKHHFDYIWKVYLDHKRICKKFTSICSQ